MKKSIIYSGIALIAITNVISAVNCQQAFFRENLVLTQSLQSLQQPGSSEGNADASDSAERRNISAGGDPVAAPETIGFSTYKKTMSEIIAENNKIIEDVQSDIAVPVISEDQNENNADNQISEINFPLEMTSVCGEKSMKDIIMQDSQIIENPVSIEAQPAHLGKSKKS